MVFDELDKNTVQADDQLKDTELVRFYNVNGTGKKLLLVGNSITLHGTAPQIGWEQECGMAASAPDRDYAHLLMAACPDSPFCICQVAAWEKDYKDGSRHFPDFAKARAFGADILVSRFVENCPKKEFDPLRFRQAVLSLWEYLKPKSILVTTGFWQHPGDEFLMALAQERGYPCVFLGDLGSDPQMRADGLFDHKGVAHHPGDQGMQAIADRILPHL